MAMPTETSLAGLAKLLSSSFTIDEFRQWIVAHIEPELLHELPASSTSAQFFLEVVTLFQRRGGINRAFFSALARARPGRKSEIVDVRSRFDLDKASKRTPTRSVKRSKAAGVSASVPVLVRTAAPAPTHEEVLTKKLEQSLKDFSRAGNAAEADDEWKPVLSWWKEWGPSFQDKLTADEYQQLSGTTRSPKRRTTRIGTKTFTLGESVEDRVTEVRSTLKGLVNKYKPVKPKRLRGGA